MSKKLLFVALLAVATVFSVSAQKFKKGSIDFLKTQNEVNMVFNFEGVTIDGDPEEKHVKERMADEKTSEEAEEWKGKWYGEWRESYKKNLTKYCNDELKGLTVGTYPDAQYTVMVKIIDIDPGNYAGPFSNPSKLRASFKVIKTGEENDVLALLEVKNSYNPISAMQPVEYLRIEMGFGELGKEFAKQINKAIK